jgi:DNA-binding NarL/FixJ family response regulator
MAVKVLLVEDHELTRKGMAYGLKAFENIEVTAEAENGKEALIAVGKYRPDVVLMDIAMPVLNGIDATKKIKEIYPDIKIIMLTSLNEKENVLSAFSAGANAYCIKSIKIESLVNIISMVLDGAIWVDPDIAGFILDILRAKPVEEKKGNTKDFNLTNREKEILKLISDGLCNKDIADKLFLSLHTVKNHVKSIIQKLAVDDRTQAAIMALKENLI